MRDQSRASEDYARNAGATGVSSDEQANIVCDDPNGRRSEIRRVRRLAFAFRECGISGELPEARRDHGADPFGIFEDVRDHKIDRGPIALQSELIEFLRRTHAREREPESECCAATERRSAHALDLVAFDAKDRSSGSDRDEQVGLDCRFAESGEHFVRPPGPGFEFNRAQDIPDSVFREFGFERRGATPSHAQMCRRSAFEVITQSIRRGRPQGREMKTARGFHGDLNQRRPRIDSDRLDGFEGEIELVEGRRRPNQVGSRGAFRFLGTHTRPLSCSRRAANAIHPRARRTRTDFQDSSLDSMS